MSSGVVRKSEFRGTDRYELRRVLGVGAMGVVYEAFDRDLELRVALKCLPTASPRAFFRFKQEFRSLQHLHHANLVRLGELVYERGQLFFTMELIDGLELIAYCRDEACRPESDADLLVVAGPAEATLDGEPSPSVMKGFVRARTRMRSPNEVRLRSAFVQLVGGLAALHAVNKVHRDVKPSNVLVTAHGRVVLLDFGVVASLRNASSPADGGLVGTIGYMAPEQAARKKVGPEADWYSVGTMLFEVLTGRLPFEGRASDVLLRKQQELPPRVEDVVADAPRPIAELCDRLLTLSPEMRPSPEYILNVLQTHAVSVSDSAPRAQGATFVGRQGSLEVLQQALARARFGRTCAIHIEGQSGTGKTELIHRFIAQARSEKETLVLSGRCSEREDVPYKAFDGVTDDLADFIAQSDHRGVAATFKSYRADLTRAFPVFGRVGDGPQSGSHAFAIDDPYIKRQDLFQALRDLLGAVRQQQDVIVVLDDMQWADADSLALLSVLLQPPNAPAVLFVIASRPDWSGSALLQSWGTQHLNIDNLALDEATVLASHLLVDAGYTGTLNRNLAERIAVEADGHPLFINELVRQVKCKGGGLQAPGLLEAALWSRVESLEPLGRALVKLTAIASGSLSIRVVADAAIRLGSGTPSELLSELFALCNERLLRLDGTRGQSRVELYHERVGAAVRARVASYERIDLHRAVAMALERDPAEDREALAVHWQAAGEPVRAARFALVAACRAGEVLAFERSARLYRMAFECDPDQATSEAQEQLGHALANAGLGRLAAKAYLNAAAGVGPMRRLELEHRAADQLFRAGHVDEAEPLIQRVLSHVDMNVPRSPFWSLVALLVMRLRLALTRLDVPLDAANSADARRLAQLNACWSVAVGLSMVSNMRGAYVQARHLLLALRARQAFPLLRALSAEACYVAVSGVRTRRRVEHLLQRADALAAVIRDPYGLGFTSLSKAMCSFLFGQWKQARDYAYAAERVFQQRPAGAMWELASARTFELWASFYLGDLASMQCRVPQFIHEAEARGDRYASTLHRTGLVVAVWLASDDVTTARNQVLEAEAGWSRDTFDFQRYLHTLGHCLIDLYEGTNKDAHRRILGIWPALGRSLNLRIQNLRIEAWYLRGIAALAAARAQRALLRDAERCVQALRRERLGWATTLSDLISAGICSVRDQREQALRYWYEAENSARSHGMLLIAEVAAFRRGTELGGDEGTRVLQQSHTLLRERQVKRPDRFAAVFAPGSR